MHQDDIDDLIKIGKDIRDALVKIADSVEVRMPPQRVITNLPEGSFEIGYITAGGEILPDQVEVYGPDGKHRFTYRKGVARKT